MFLQTVKNAQRGHKVYEKLQSITLNENSTENHAGTAFPKLLQENRAR